MESPHTSDADTQPPEPVGGEIDPSPRGTVVRAGSGIRLFLDRWPPGDSPGWIGRLFGASPLPRASSRDYREAATEFAIAELLRGLGSEWRLAHGLTLRADGAGSAAAPRDDVGHVMVGDRGVFALTVVNPSGLSVWVSGHSFVHDGVRMSHLRDAEFNALRLSQKLYEHCGLRVEVIPGVVVANPRRLIIDRPPLRVAVLRPNEIVPWVNGHSRTLSVHEADVVAEAARMLVQGADGSTLADLLTRFRDIRTRVLNARRRRIGWIALALLAGWMLLVAALGWG